MTNSISNFIDSVRLALLPLHHAVFAKSFSPLIQTKFARHAERFVLFFAVVQSDW